jgi:hypothetical protein
VSRTAKRLPGRGRGGGVVIVKIRFIIVDLEVYHVKSSFGNLSVNLFRFSGPGRGRTAHWTGSGWIIFVVG